MLQFLFLFLVTAPQFGAGIQASPWIFPPPQVPIEASIDFGPAGKPAIQKEVIIREGMTPKQALKQFTQVTEGKTCCHAAEVKGINGVDVDPLANRWWRLKINGTSQKASPHKSHLKAHDRMEWVYFEDQQ